MPSFACALVALTLAGQGEEGKYMETVIQDDAVFLHRKPSEVGEAARRVANLGGDRIRLTASWSDLAPEPQSRRMPGGSFKPTDSTTYPQGRFRSLDTAVKAARNAGIDVQIDLAFWAPRWATRLPSENKRRQRKYVVPERFAEFSKAVARRYAGDYVDPDGRGRLPKVTLWTTWNEPNHPSFLSPQWAKDGKGGFRPMSPHVYRAMHNAAYASIKDVSRDNQVLMGGTASMGSAVPGKGGVPPLQFARELACVDRNLAPLRVPECRGFHPLKADGWSHHPYSRYTTPGTPATNPDDAPLADTDRLSALLEELRKRGRLAAKLPIHQTEYGYETRQDDPFHAPFGREEQALFMGWATFLAWKHPDTRAMAQFLLQDIDPRESGHRPGTRSFYRDWQSGLYAADGRPKPAVQAFKLPFWAELAGEGDRRMVRLFGQVRPGRGPQTVRIERLDPRTNVWRPLQTLGSRCTSGDETGEFQTDGSGFLLRAAPFDGQGHYRLAWEYADGKWQAGVGTTVFGA